MKSILVTGDFLVDHHIYEGKRHHFGEQNCPGVSVKSELGGAALIHQLVNEVLSAAGPQYQSVLAIDETQALLPVTASAGANNANQPFSAYAFWRPYRSSGKSQEEYWRVAKAMGFGGGPATNGHWPWTKAKILPAPPDALVISEGGMGFRSRMNVAHWGFPVRDKRLRELYQEAHQAAPASSFPVTEHEPAWIVLKMSAPVGEGDLWRELSQFHAEKLVTVVSATELRRANVRLGRGLSWEQTLEDLHAALKSHAGVQSLLKCRHLIITFDCEGAVWIRNEGDQRKATFLFDPEAVEGERRRDQEGDVYGQMSCMTAMIVAELASATDSPNLEAGMRRGLVAMRHLCEQGHGNAAVPGTGFPAQALAAATTKENASEWLQGRTIDCDDATCPVRSGWSLLALHESSAARASGVPLYGIARRVLIQGPRALRAPILKVGDYTTADRGEIEALRSLRQLVHGYDKDLKADKPLSIGVFGPPGAGKSFAVKELAKDLLRDRLGWLEFNLSQFNGPKDLIGALHQVRDKILEGKTPVAFFDEFDSQNLNWLKYLLAPMQDGRFQEEQISHPVGRCLFIFAGGTSHSFEDFEAKAQDRDREKAHHFVLSKGPDFASRLDGRLNVIGPNPRSATSTEDRDIFFPVRRALFIRSKLKCKENERLALYPSLATALLELPKFKHGSRSLTKLLDSLKTHRQSQPTAPLGLSALPPEDQLVLHVEIEKFEALIQRDEATANRLGVDQLAEGVHEFYRQKAKVEKWLKPHHDCDFADLAPFDQASNRAAARRIPAILALVGLKLVDGHATTEERAAVDAVLIAQEDLLGEAEHDGWMDWHFENGWSQSESRDDARQWHNRLVPYCDLPEKEQRKDKDAIHHFPDIVDRAGLKIVSGAPA